MVTLKNSPGSDYSVMTADDWDSGAVAWIAEGAGDDLLRLSTTMTLSTEAALPSGTPVEMKEMPDGAAEEEKVVVLGKDGSDLWLLTHDRDTDTADDVALSNLTPTGLATAGPEYAYVTANETNGDGHLLRADVAPLAFDSSPRGLLDGHGGARRRDGGPVDQRAPRPGRGGRDDGLRLRRGRRGEPGRGGLDPGEPHVRRSGRVLGGGCRHLARRPLLRVRPGGRGRLRGADGGDAR